MPQRIIRINQLIKILLSQIILKEFEFKKEALVTLTRVKTSPDLAESQIFISVWPKEKEEKILKILNKNKKLLQKILNKKLKIKKVPRIVFVKEEILSEAAKIEEILVKLKKENKGGKI